jgi:hypothetical protein
MPINKSNIIFIGNAGGICGYLSHGINIIRKSSSLTTKRVAEEPEFEGFRNSGNRMRQASPIAASLYQLLPKKQKVYALYRTLTGEVLKMIKQGIEVELIVTRLKEQYIDPILEGLVKSENQSKKDQSYTRQSKVAGNSRLFSGDLFKILPYKRGDKRHLRSGPVPQYANAGTKLDNLSAEHYSDELIVQNDLEDDVVNQQSPKLREQSSISKYSELTYLGRLPECRGLKMWLRPNI